jgi:hypothetical protein
MAISGGLTKQMAGFPKSRYMLLHKVKRRDREIEGHSSPIDCTAEVAYVVTSADCRLICTSRETVPVQPGSLDAFP